MSVRRINGTLCMDEERFNERFSEMDLDFNGYVVSYLHELPSSEGDYTPPTYRGMYTQAQAHILPSGDDSFPKIEVTVNPSKDGIGVELDDGLDTFSKRVNGPDMVRDTIMDLAVKAQEHYMQHQAALDRVNSFLDEQDNEDTDQSSDFEDLKEKRKDINIDLKECRRPE